MRSERAGAGPVEGANASPAAAGIVGLLLPPSPTTPITTAAQITTIPATATAGRQDGPDVRRRRFGWSCGGAIPLAHLVLHRVDKAIGNRRAAGPELVCHAPLGLDLPANLRPGCPVALLRRSGVRSRRVDEPGDRSSFLLFG